MPIRTRIIMTIATVAALVAVGWVLWYLATPGSPTAALRRDLRMPRNMPGLLEVLEGGLPQNSVVRGGFERPWLTILWFGREGLDLSVLLGVVDREVEMDLGGRERTSVIVDGVEGWLTHLGPTDFYPPTERKDFNTFTSSWRYDRTIYRRALDYRGTYLWGPAIVLQWNREGTHYLLMAQEREPMNVDLLLQMANSMAPGEFPFEIGPYGVPEGSGG